MAAAAQGDRRAAAEAEGIAIGIEQRKFSFDPVRAVLSDRDSGFAHGGFPSFCSRCGARPLRSRVYRARRVRGCLAYDAPRFIHADGESTAMRALKERFLYYGGFLLGGFWFFACSAAGIVWLLFRPGNRQTIYVFSRVFCRTLARWMGWRIEVEHRERLEENRPCVLISNHQSFLDLVTFGSIVTEKTVAAGKKEIARIPIFGWFFRVSGNLLIDRGDHREAMRSLAQAARILREEAVSVWFTPEGHRNTKPRLLPFKMGAFRLAVAAGVPLVPVVAEPLSAVADTEHHLARPGVLRMKVLEPISTEKATPQDAPALARLAQERMQTAFDELAGTRGASSERAAR
jgi:1-acyl-sn-glycerol-3-phosphate acyltransferase